jgi:2Fe-2S ferredoxin
VRITFVDASGAVHRVDAAAGTTVKNAALDNAVPGILGECGGCATCGTCHGYVDQAYLDLLPPPDDIESTTLEGVAAELMPASRLTCRITVTDELDGLLVRLPETQV